MHPAERPQIFNETFTSIRFGQQILLAERNLNLRMRPPRARRKIPPSTDRPAAPTATTSATLHCTDLPKITAADSTRSRIDQVVNRSVQTAGCQTLGRSAGQRRSIGIVLHPTSRSNCDGLPPRVSPGREYTTTSPRRRSHFGHKDRRHNDLCKIAKTQTIFRRGSPFHPSPKAHARQLLASRATRAFGTPSKYGSLGAKAVIR
jgi:hypothetical protein